MSDAQAKQDLESYVTVDHACIEVLPLLVSQLEIANQQLADGVNTLIEGFMLLSRQMNEVDPHSLGNISEAIDTKVQRIHRFTEDLIQAGERMHITSIEEATKDDNQKARQSMNRIVLRTLDVQQLAGEIRKEAGDVVKEIESLSQELETQQNGSEQDTRLLKTFMEIQMELNKMIVAFQFQDRVTQIISAVTNATKDLIDYITEARAHHESEQTPVVVNISEMKQRIEAYYISPEQYELKGEHKDDTSDDIELF